MPAGLPPHRQTACPAPHRLAARRPPLAALLLLSALAIVLVLPSALADPPPGMPLVANLPWKLDRPARRTLDAVPWQHRRYQDTVVIDTLQPVTDSLAVSTEPRSSRIDLPVSLPDGGEFYLAPKSESLGDWDRLEVHLELPADFPAATLVYVWVKDWDNYWSQIRCELPPNPTGRITLTVPLTGPDAERLWKGRGHYRPWNQRSPWQIAELGLKFAAPADTPITWQGVVAVRSLQLLRLAPNAVPRPVVRDVSLRPGPSRVGAPVELSFQLTHPFRDPFDRREVDLTAIVTQPDGTMTQLRAFYFENFLLDEEAREAVPVPFGYPEFRIRYTPVLPGKHSIEVQGYIRGIAVTLPPATLDIAADPTWRGFVRLPQEDAKAQGSPASKAGNANANRNAKQAAPDWRFLEWDQNGEPFNPVPINMRSPYDTRYVAEFPFSNWDETDLRIYKRLFPKYKAAGINVVEVWMSSWWLALEWIPDAPGLHGVGYYNQHRAWKLDRLFEWAAENDLQLILVFNNHGKFSNWCDQEWDRNPYNRTNGGFLDTPEDYFTRDKAQAAARSLIDYLAARWGHSDRLLAWKLFTEIDLTGNTNNGWYKTPAVADWHSQMGAYLKQVDPNRHLVTTHWSTSYERVNDLLAKRPELDFLTLDIYYTGKGANRLWSFMENTLNFMDNLKKPCLITEFGGSPWADSLDHMRNQLHLGLWSGWFGGMVGSPGFWWFQLVEEQNLYHEYRAVANFVEGERRDGARRYRSNIPGTDLNVMELRTADERWYWAFDPDFYFAGDLRRVPITHSDLKLPMRDLTPGRYTVEVWDCQTGTIRDSFEYEARSGSNSSLTLPTFEKDISIKVRRLSADAAR